MNKFKSEILRYYCCSVEVLNLSGCYYGRILNVSISQSCNANKVVLTEKISKYSYTIFFRVNSGVGNIKFDIPSWTLIISRLFRRGYKNRHNEKGCHRKTR